MLGVICFTSDICLDWLCDYISLDAGTFSECFRNLGGGKGGVAYETVVRNVCI